MFKNLRQKIIQFMIMFTRYSFQNLSLNVLQIKIKISSIVFILYILPSQLPSYNSVLPMSSILMKFHIFFTSPFTKAN